MRTSAAALIGLLAGCGDLTDGQPPSLGRCAESTPDWWPLHEGNRWVYDELDLDANPPEARKELRVQAAPAPVLGLAGAQPGVRTWRSDPDGTGWRWFIDEDSAISFRRDVWLEGPREDEVCPWLAADEDVRSCAEATPAEELYYLPGRKRLDYRADRVCERSAWTESHLVWTVAIGDEDGKCYTADWRSGPDACVASSSLREEHWSVVSVGRRIAVPAGVFEDCLCVRRVIDDTVDPRDATYCFAKGIGKVYELDVGSIVECLAEYCLEGAPCVTPAADAVACSAHVLDP